MSEQSQHPAAPTPAAASAAASPSTSRRRWILGAAGLTAAAAGAGIALWKDAVPAPGSAQDPALQAFWQLQLQTPQGQPQSLQAYRGKPLLVNFWATWCPPCVRELPLLSRFAQQAAEQLQVLGLAVDQAPNVQRWLQRQPLAFPVLMAGAGGMGLTRSLGNESGGLPFSLLLDGQGLVRQRKIGELSDAQLQQWLLEIEA